MHTYFFIQNAPMLWLWFRPQKTTVIEWLYRNILITIKELKVQVEIQYYAG